ncbi:MAG: hypothetical protein ACYC6P_09640 [Ignavibacteriaceae bacterium]
MSKSKKLLGLFPTKFPSVSQVQLNLEMQTRYIAKLDTAGEGTLLTNRKPNHIFHKYGGEQGSLGINHSHLTDESIPFKWIVIDFDGHKLVTSRLYFLSRGKCYQFGKSGFELQCFLPLSEFGLNKAREFEARQLIQENLFSEAV